MKSDRRELLKELLLQLPLVVALVGLWALLWGSISWLTLLTGVVVAFTVTRVFYLPPVALSGRFNPYWFAVFALTFAADLFVASFQVAFQALNPRWDPHPSIVAVHMRTNSDLILSLTSMATSLVPGTLVVDVDREHSILYLHSLSTRSIDDIPKVRRHTLEYERRIALALGDANDVRAVNG
ncbi:Na+/H+ antiporter subunit E [Lysobacter korlensis]|uniref:Na+/H+ antiporter subunit E n=1 Tax=Lysobacter korlensis TaxID=553636 RepID=A0ABV6RXL7_9GAMM